MSASVSISVDDFAEDIKGPILPILDALGLIGGTGDDLDLAGWNFQKAIDFIPEIQNKPMVITMVTDLSRVNLEALKQFGEVTIVKEKRLFVN